MKRNKTVHLIGTVAFVTLFAKLLGIVREALQARVFGTQLAADLYTTANNNTIYLFTTAAYALCIAAVPILAPASSGTGRRASPPPGTSWASPPL